MSQSMRDAQHIADDVLFPAAIEVERSGRVPKTHLDLLAEKGFYSLAAPEELTTLDLPDYPAVQRVVELLAGGCLTTAFVWVQHHGAMSAAAKTSNETIRAEYLAPLAAGARRAGMAIGAAARPGPPMLRATAVPGGWRFTGTAPWVTGWDMVDTLYVAARQEDDVLVWALVDATESASMTVRPLEMIAVQASRTVTLEFHDHFVPDDRVTALQPRSEYLEGDAESLRFTGSLARGVADRAIRLMGEDGAALSAELASVRERLQQAAPQDVPVGRAVSSEFALRAAAALFVHQGSSSVLIDSHPQRLLREAAFLLNFGTRPTIRQSLLDQLTTPRDHGVGTTPRFDEPHTHP
ncbi:acyl-CoA dehydrogenase family protein [Cryptosporangium minutisporangium]|uniref:Acyl-CoA dehydrogenase/oxidase N-terminal domain-containing protein n=1 Tax=Cryptosporangium minutisporangium TaxID=113569 RepID=A0ABP6T3L8_9ACTN